MPDSAQGLGLSDSEWRKICSTQQAQESILFLLSKMEDKYFALVEQAATLEQLLYTKAYASILRELKKKLVKTRKDMEAKAKVARNKRTRLPFPTE